MTVTCHVRFCSRVGRGDFLHLDNNISQIFNYTLKGVTFSFLSNGNKSERVFDSNFDKGRFNVNISDIPVNAS